MKSPHPSFLKKILAKSKEKLSSLLLQVVGFGLMIFSILLAVYRSDELYIHRISFLILFIGLCSFLIARFIKKEYHPAVIVNSLFILVFFWILELTFQIKQYYSSYIENLKNAAESEGLYFDERNTLDVIRDLREANIDAYPVFNSTFWSRYNDSNLPNYHVYPLGGLSKVTTVYCNENGNYTIYLSGVHGFRNPIDMEINQEQENLNRKSILVIGDSFAHGACVGTGESFPAELRKKNLRVWNFASGGLGPMSEYAILKEYGKVIKPQTILWVYYHGNDLPSLHQSTLNPILQRYLHEESFTQNLSQRQTDIDFFWRKYYANYFSNNASSNIPRKTFSQIFSDTLKVSLLRDRYSLITGYSKAKKEIALSHFETILKQARSTASNWGGNFIFVYVPAIETLFQKYPKDADIYGFNKKDVLNILQANNIPFIDIEEKLYAHPDYKSLFPFEKPAHFNSMGYDYMADAVFNHAVFQNLVLQAP